MNPATGELPPIEGDRFTDAFVLINETSTQLQKIDTHPWDRRAQVCSQHLVTLEEAGVTPIFTDKDSSVTQDTLARNLEYTELDPEAPREEQTREAAKGKTLWVAGGDGSVKEAMKFAQGKNINVVPLWAGNTVAAANMLNGSPYDLSIHELADQARVVPIYPMEINITTEDETIEELAVAWVGLGTTGRLCEDFNAESHRGHNGYPSEPHRFMLEAKIIGKRRFSLSNFRVLDSRSMGSQDVHWMNDITFTNGPRMAKVIKHFPVELDDRRIFVYSLESGKLLGPERWLGRLAIGKYIKPRGEYVEEGQTYDLTAVDPVTMHTDAETLIVPPGALVSIGQSKTPFHALSTLLPRQKQAA